jgi:uncharacterized protein YdhG (YjbR/CyaY superfamily)
MAQKYADVDAYLADLEERPAAVVQLVRRWAHEEIPGLRETVAYNMPTFERDGTAVLHLAGWKRFVSVYPEPPAPADDAGLVLDLAPYSSGKGTLRFPLAGLDEPLVRRTLRALGRA